MEQGSNDVERLEHNLVAAVRAHPDLSAAGIEFMFFQIRNSEEIPALVMAAAKDPSRFQEVLMLCRERRVGAKDPSGWEGQIENVTEGVRDSSDGCQGCPVRRRTGPKLT